MLQANLSLQVVPINTADAYPIIDAAITVIQDSGIEYKVTAFNTQMEGPLDQLLIVVQKAQAAAFAAGGEELLLNIQIHAKRETDVHLSEKTAKFD